MSDLLKQGQNATIGTSANQTANTFFSSLGTGAVVFGIQFAIFLLIKDRIPRLYQPRSYLVPEDERTKALPKGLFRWLLPTWKTSSVEIVHKCGLDAYFFLRYLGMLIKIFTPMMVTVLPILLCVNGIGGKGPDYANYAPYNNSAYQETWMSSNQTQLNLLVWGNVRPDQHNRYWAHLILAVGVVAWCLYVFYDELRGFIRLRQAYLLSPQHRIRASATTVLVQAISAKWCTVEALEGLFDVYPGGIRNIWINRNYDKLLELVKDRDKLANKLESAETELIRKCRQANLDKQKRQNKKSGSSRTKKDKIATEKEETQRAEKQATEANVQAAFGEESPLAQAAESPGRGSSKDTDGGETIAEHDDAPKAISVDPRIDKPDSEESQDSNQEIDYLDASYDPRNDGEPTWKQYIQDDQRPTMRLALWNQGWLDWIPFTGQKVDTIDYCRKEVARMTAEIEKQQAKADEFPLMNSAFVQFNLQIAAHMACQSVTHHVPDQMAPRLVEISPGDVIWDNMSMKWWERWLWTVIVTIIVVAMIIFYAIPYTFIGLLSHFSALAAAYPWLEWLNRIKPPWNAVLQGILPPALTGLLLFLIPLIMRYLSKLRGSPTRMLVELNVSDYYFWFLFVELFLVITVAAGFLTILGHVNDLVTGIPTLLASNIPNASNYYFSYLLLQGLNNSAAGLLQVVTLLLWFLWGPLVDSTAREKWNRQINLPTVNWGSFFPAFTNLACIGLIYSIISPLMIVFNLLSFVLFWFAYRYLTIYVNAFKFDTGGLLFPKAINQMFVGLYVMEICLIGLFFLVQGVAEDGAPVGAVCVPQAIVMIVVAILTIIAQVRLNLSFGPLFRYLPITLEDEAAERDESFALMQKKKFGDGNDDETGSINDALEERERKSTEEHEMHNLPPVSKESQHNQRGLEHDPIAAAIKRNTIDDREKVLYDNIATRGVLGIAKQPLKAVGLAKNQLDRGLDLLQIQKLKLELPPNVEAALNSHGAISNALFAGMHSSLDELSPEQRDALTQEAFKHEALRARRRIMWIPHDELGVAADEIARTRRYSKYLEISSEGTALNGKGKVVFGKSPPDFRQEDLIEL